MTREEAITAIKTWIGCMRETYNDNEFAMEFVDGAETLMKDALKQPERVHGRWKYRSIHKFNSNGQLIKYCDIPCCSECGREYGTIRDIQCCNCGAIMNEVE